MISTGDSSSRNRLICLRALSQSQHEILPTHEDKLCVYILNQILPDTKTVMYHISPEG